jgi:hypothetical protein
MPATGREENLRKIEPGDMAAELGSKGGKKSAEVKQKQRDLRRAMQVLLEASYKVPARDERTQQVKRNKAGQPVLKSVSGAELLATMAFQKAVKGDLHAFELVRDTSGQKPIERTMSAEVPPEVLAEIDRLMNEDDEEEQEEQNATDE